MIPRAALLHFFALASLIASLCACSAPADHPALKNAELPALIPAFRYVYRGTASGGYTIILDVGNLTTFTVPNLLDGTSYYFAVRAYDAAGDRSPYSNEVAATTPPPPPPPPPPSDTTPPTVKIANPWNGTYLSMSTKINVTASDNVGVASIVVLADGVQIASTNLSSLSFAWNTNKVAKGAHTLTATAKDAAGNAASSSITVYKR